MVSHSSDVHNRMMNVTARLAVKIQNLPDWEVDWADKSPQQSRQALTCDHFLPSQEDATQLQKRAIQFMKKFLTSHFSSLRALKQFVPSYATPHAVSKAEVVPMKVLFKDEKYKSETVEILKQLMSDANLHGDHQVKKMLYMYTSKLVMCVLQAQCTYMCTLAYTGYCG